MAIALDGYSQIASDTGSPPYTLNHTCGGVQRLLVLVFSGIRLVATSWGPVNVTYNGIAMTLQATAEEIGNSRAVRTSVYTLVNPPAGASYQASVTTGGVTVHWSMSLISLTGVDQTTPTGATGADNGNKSGYSASLTTSVPSAWLIGGAGIRNGTLNWTPGSGVTELFEHTTGSSSTDDLTGCVVYRACTSAGLYTLDATASGSNRGALGAVEIKPAAAAPAAWFGAELVAPAAGMWMF